MKNLTNLEVSSYAGGVLSLGAGLTLESWGVIVGILTALLTFALNVFYAWRRDRREQRESDARMAAGLQTGGAK